MAGSPRGTHTYLHDGWRFLVATGCTFVFRKGGGGLEESFSLFIRRARPSFFFF